MPIFDHKKPEQRNKTLRNIEELRLLHWKKRQLASQYRRHEFIGKPLIQILPAVFDIPPLSE